MRKTHLLAFLLFFSTLGYANPDTILLESLKEKALSYESVNLDSAQFFASQILDYCAQDDVPKYHAFALNWMGLMQMYQGNLDAADSLFEQTIQYSKTPETERYKLLAKFNISANYLNRNAFDEAISLGMEALKGFQNEKDYTNVARVKYHIGACYFYMDQLDRASKYFQEAIELSKEYDTPQRLADVYSALGSVYYAQGKLDMAIYENKKSIDVKVSVGAENSCGPQYLNVGDMYMSTGNLDSAEVYFRKSMQVTENWGDGSLIGMLYNELSTLNYLKGEVDSSLFYAYKALKVYSKTKDEQTRILALERLAMAYEKLGKYDSALVYSQKHSTLKDSLNSVELKARIAEYDEKYRSAEKDQEILEGALLLEEQRSQNLMQWLVIVGLVLLIGFTFWWFYSRKQKQKIENNLRMSEERNRIAMDLHDHVGAELTLVTSKLDSRIYKAENQIEKEELEQLSTQIRKVNSTLRETVWSIQQESVTTEELQEKVEYMMYALFQGLDTELTSVQDCDLKLNPQQALTFYRISQEAISNIYKYAKASKVEWNLTCNQNVLRLVIKDNGEGFDPSKTSQGFGLGNMKLRAEKIGATVSIESKIGLGTRIILEGEV